MPALEIYDLWYPSMDGIGALADSTSVSFQTENKDVDIDTIHKGFAGTTPAPLKVTGKISLMDPVTGSIFAQLKQRERQRTVNIITMTKGSGETFQIPCYIRNVAASGGVGDPAKIDFDFVGKDVE